MIIGASPETDGQILRLTEFMYQKYDLKRVYYSSYAPVVRDPLLPDTARGLLREHRLYQADWLLRFYGFTCEEITPAGENLPTEYDPKCAWALRNMQYFPVEVNKAGVEKLLRVPGIGAKGAYKIVTARKYAALTFEDLRKMRIVLKRARHFITCSGKFYGARRARAGADAADSGERSEGAKQLSLFDAAFSAPSLLPETGNACPSRIPERKAIFIKFLRRGRAFGLDGAIIKARGRVERNEPLDEGRKEPNGFSNKRQR